MIYGVRWEGMVCDDVSKYIILSDLLECVDAIMASFSLMIQ